MKTVPKTAIREQYTHNKKKKKNNNQDDGVQEFGRYLRLYMCLSSLPSLDSFSFSSFSFVFSSA